MSQKAQQHRAAGRYQPHEVGWGRPFGRNRRDAGEQRVETRIWRECTGGLLFMKGGNPFLQDKKEEENSQRRPGEDSETFHFHGKERKQR